MLYSFFTADAVQTGAPGIGNADLSYFLYLFGYLVCQRVQLAVLDAWYMLRTKFLIASRVSLPFWGASNRAAAAPTRAPPTAAAISGSPFIVFIIYVILV